MAEYIVDTTATGCDGYCPASERIVRCRECANAYKRGNDMLCEHPRAYLQYDDTLEVWPDGFCAWGEVRE